MRKTVLRWGIAILTVSGLSLAAACSGQEPNTIPTPTPSASEQAAVDTPDCDSEDIVTRDTDCGFQVKPTKTTKPPAPGGQGDEQS